MQRSKKFLIYEKLNFGNAQKHFCFTAIHIQILNEK